MRKSLLQLCLLSTPLFLSACGEGWEVQKVDNVFPYGNERTAGSGIAYVRAKMLPEKDLKIDPVAVQDEMAVAKEVKPVLNAEEIFEDAQVKGVVRAEPVNKEVGVSPEEVSPATKDDDSAALGVDSDTEIAAIIDTPSGLNIEELSAEEYISHAPHSISEINLEVMAIDEVIDIEPEAGGGDMYLDEMEMIEVYEKYVSEPIKEIIVPKKDLFDFKSDGQASLDEIYGDPLMDNDY